MNIEKYLNEGYKDVTKKDLSDLKKTFSKFEKLSDDLLLKLMSQEHHGELKEAIRILGNMGDPIEEINKRLENLTIDKIRTRR